MRNEYINLDLDSALSNQHSVLLAGVDEAGRGALFGPVVAAAVILPPAALPELVACQVRDSKQLSSYRRQQLAEKICLLAVDWRVGFASTAEIDSINILQASLLAMKRAVTKLKVKPELCLVDGNQAIKDLALPQQTLIKGDERSLVIAAASIIAKVWRDDLILRLAAKYPMYDLVSNKGYGTARHLQALQQYGPSRLHRLSFRPCQVRAMAVGGVGE
ncbi:ribonuclease HII [Gloeocapsopsis dulcis]|uniref:Ribonuclease HII n=1 Tax=Gloeocapsopsis dulcis AAB1 = 1H9 TaxID=1433147 RepID=A0A6N8FTK3_9CHRO|nr:ribonuclease HII [Gloeocapsopsis dulcis]MUL36433.1 ribonuclease HII [Gloeocapsopsis dulcis AAB1 = 1H9]WNN88071.1 ribonuclease HII [Gloeocapsopsis dulcis]